MAYDRHNAGDTRAWLDAGLAAHRRGDFDQAIAAYSRALAVTPEDADASNLLGTALLQSGRAPDAVGHLERAARRQRDNAMVLANLAQAYLAVNRFDNAREAFRKAARIEPQQLHFQMGIATALAMGGELDQAKALLERLCLRFPDVSLVWLNLGNVLRDQQHFSEAVDAYRKALQLDPALIDARNAIGSALHSMQRFSEAEAHYRECIARAAEYMPARFNLASVLIDVGRMAEAEVICHDLISSAPDRTESYSLMAAAVGHQGRLIEASSWLARAAALDPKNPRAIEAHGALLIETGRAPEGLRLIAQAAALTATSTGPLQTLSTALLAQGQLQDGWTAYESRSAAIRLREKHAHVSFCRSLGQNLQGCRVCVGREQGLGDEIFFLRYARVLAARGARITYRASNKIATVLSRVDCIDEIVEEIAPLSNTDVHILVGDLPHALGAAPSTILRSPPLYKAAAIREFSRRIALYWPPVAPTLSLPPIPEKLHELREALAQAGPPPYIGVTWRGGTPPEEQNSVTWLLYKTIGLSALADTLRGTSGTLVALQRNPRDGEIEAFSQALGRPVHDFTALNDDLEAMLALIALIDDYIGVSNTNMHLRAAVGQTARVLVPVPAEWRWLQSGRSSPWFPGFSIYRQSLKGDWTRALGELKRDLEANYASSTRSNAV